MCRGSVFARSTERAVPGVNYEISESCHDGDTHRQGVLHRKGQGPLPRKGKDGAIEIACAACIRNPMEVLLTNIPKSLQERLKVGVMETVEFLPGADTRAESQDQVRLKKDGRQFKLREFANQGVQLLLLVGDDQVEQKAKTSATAVAAHSLT